MKKMLEIHKTSKPPILSEDQETQVKNWVAEYVEENIKGFEGAEKRRRIFYIRKKITYATAYVMRRIRDAGQNREFRVEGPNVRPPLHFICDLFLSEMSPSAGQ